MGTPFLGEMKVVSFGFPPKGWAACNGQLLPINQNQALFSLLGTIYGGDGRTTFGLPNLQGRTPMHFGNGLTLGQQGGESNHTLTLSEMPAHQHTPSGSANTSTSATPGNNYWGSGALACYSASQPNTAMAASAIGSAGGSQAHLNTQPYLVLYVVIALQGIFPSQN